jgi:arylsulfatase A-like enzyme/tetratricopeptide (TPR) repeat protein
MKFSLRLAIGWILLAGGLGLAAWYLFHRPGDGGSEVGRLAPPERRPVVLITLDTTRADHLEPYGSERVSTPVLQEFSERAMLFERAYAVTPITLPSHTTILTGQVPPKTGVRNNGTHYVPENVETLATVLQSEGYRTGAFISASVLDSRYGLDRGFDVYDDDLSAGLTRHERMVPDRPAGATVGAAAAWLDTIEPGEDFFLWVHLYDPHAAYNPPPPFRDQYRDDLYAGEIAYMDAQIGVLLDHPALQRENEPIVTIIGDHGESLGEHGEQTHGILVYDSTMQVPWMLRIPGVPGGLRMAMPVSQVDLVPTVLGSLGIDAPTDVDGLDLTVVLADETMANQMLLERGIYGECYLPFYTYGWSKLHTVRVGADKLIDAPEPELYDTRRDPREMTNRIETGGNIVHDLDLQLEAFLEGESEAEEAATLEIDSSTQEQLRALGYLAVGSGPIEVEGERASPIDMIHLHVGLERARQFMAFSMYDEAIEELYKVLESDANNLAAMVDLAASLRIVGRIDDARAMMLEALEVDPEYSKLHLMLAQLESLSGRRDRGRELAQGVLEREPRNIEATIMRASIHIMDGERDQARVLLTEALEREPENTRLQAFFARSIEIPLGEVESAEARLVAALDRDPFMAEAWLVLGRMQKEQGRVAEAEASFEQGLVRSPDDANLHRELGLLLAEQGASDRARTHLEESIRLANQMNSEAHVALGALLAQQGRVVEATKHYDLVLEREPRNPGARNNRAIVLIRVGQIDEAERDLEQLVKDHPDYADAHNNLAMVASLRQQWPRAERHARRATEIAPNSADAWSNLGYALTELDRLEEAEQALRKALQVSPNHWRARFNLGSVLRRMGRYEEAAAELTELAASQPRVAEVHLELGDLYAGPLDRPQQARTHYQAVLRIAPQHPRAEEIRALLTTLG